MCMMQDFVFTYSNVVLYTEEVLDKLTFLKILCQYLHSRSIHNVEVLCI